MKATATPETLVKWAHDRALEYEVTTRIVGLSETAVKVAFGSLSAEFFKSIPRLVIRWDDDSGGGMFAGGLPLDALAGMVAGFLGVPALPPGWVGYDLTDSGRYRALRDALNRKECYERDRVADDATGAAQREADFAGEMYEAAETVVSDGPEGSDDPPS